MLARLRRASGRGSPASGVAGGEANFIFLGDLNMTGLDYVCGKEGGSPPARSRPISISRKPLETGGRR
jgi:hypothetical protein